MRINYRLIHLEEVTLKAGVNTALDAILEDRLAAICGAGLSMAEPSNLPSAHAIAHKAKLKHDAIYGPAAAPLSDDIEEQAEFFLAKGQLGTMYLSKMVDHDTFSAPPNAGHYAVADLLLTNAIKMAVSTNVDALIEYAGDKLFGGVVAATTRDNAAKLFPERSPLLKIHGCWKQDFQNTVWAPSQLNCEPNKSRINACAGWVENQLLNRDLIIVGYFSDWNYLNSIIEQCLEAVSPSNVIVVDPSPTADLLAKAPALYSVGDKASGGFYHVCCSGADFLSELRKQWSISYIRQVFTSGNILLTDNGDERANFDYCEPPDADVKVLWSMRRDLEGAGPNDACKRSQPKNDPNLGRMHILMRAAGAELNGSHWRLRGQNFRIIGSSGQSLNQVEKAHSSSVSPWVSADVTIAAGARDYSLKANIARSVGQPNIVRARASRFVTDEQAELEFDL